MYKWCQIAQRITFVVNYLKCEFADSVVLAANIYMNRAQPDWLSMNASARPCLFNCQIPILKDTLLLKYSIWFPNFRWLPIVILNFTSLEQWIILPLKLKLQDAITLITVDWNLPRSTFLELNFNEFNTFLRSINSISS